VLAERALAAVEPAARQVVVGIYALGLSRNEIARRTGISPRLVARLHDAALERMRLALCRT
jgi:DNA-directed RNA polymerase specialized sigma subunit